MTEDVFWETVERFHTDPFGSLSHFNRFDLVELCRVFQQMMRASYKLELLHAAFVIESYVSDDTFDDFRSWLIGRGRAKFKDALANVDSIANWLSPDEILAGIEEFTFINEAEKAYSALGGLDDEFYRSIGARKDSRIEISWPESKIEFEEMYPRLVGAFWNSEKIRGLHG